MGTGQFWALVGTRTSWHQWALGTADTRQQAPVATSSQWAPAVHWARTVTDSRYWQVIPAGTSGHHQAPLSCGQWEAVQLPPPTPESCLALQPVGGLVMILGTTKHSFSATCLPIYFKKISRSQQLSKDAQLHYSEICFLYYLNVTVKIHIHLSCFFSFLFI